jgi:hypothetical protein
MHQVQDDPVTCIEPTDASIDQDHYLMLAFAPPALLVPQAHDDGFLFGTLPT